jgi:hypothetical protein
VKLPSSSEISRDQSCTFAGVEVSKPFPPLRRAWLDPARAAHPGRVADVDRTSLTEIAPELRRLARLRPVLTEVTGLLGELETRRVHRGRVSGLAFSHCHADVPLV